MLLSPFPAEIPEALAERGTQRNPIQALPYSLCAPSPGRGVPRAVPVAVARTSIVPSRALVMRSFPCPAVTPAASTAPTARAPEEAVRVSDRETPVAVIAASAAARIVPRLTTVFSPSPAWIP